MSDSAFPDRPGVVASLVPLTARPTLFYDLRSAPLNGIFVGVQTLLPWVLKETLGGSDWEVALLSAAPSVCHLLDIYWAHLCQDRSKIPFVLWPGLIARFLIVLSGLVVHSWMLVVLGWLSYLVGSISTPAVNSIWRTNYPGTHRYGVVGAVLSVSTLFASLTGFVAGMLLKTYENGWLFRVVLACGGLAGMAGVLVFSRIRVRGEPVSDAPASRPLSSPDRAGRARTPGTVVARLRRRLARMFEVTFAGASLLRENPKFGKYMLIQFITGFSNMMTGPVLVSLLKYQEADWLKAAVVLTVASEGIRALLLPFWGRVLQRFNPMLARGCFNMLWASSFLLIGLSGRAIWMVIVARLVTGVAMGATTLLWQLQQMYFARKEEVTRYMGVHCTLTGVRGLIAPFLGVFLMNHVFHGDPHYVFFLSFVLVACASFLSLRMAQVERRNLGSSGHVDGGGVEK